MFRCLPFILLLTVSSATCLLAQDAATPAAGSDDAESTQTANPETARPIGPNPDPFLEQSEADNNLTPIVKQVRPSLVTIRVQGRDGDELGLGTGFVIDASGLIATNFHVIMEGRRFSVELPGQRKLKVLSVHAADRGSDLALIKVDPGEIQLRPLALADSNSPAIDQGTTVLAFGNPLGLKHSVVRGIVSAIRDIDGRQMIQVAMPIEFGNSGGPLVDLSGKVHGIINMKSAIEDRVGFAIPVERLRMLAASPNPVVMDRWVRLGRLNTDHWTPLFGASWKQRSGMMTVQGQGSGFGGRSLCLSKKSPPEMPFEIATTVRLDDEAGAAGLVFHSDGENRHYGFYPSNGNLRLSCFRGPSVFSWQVLEEVASSAYVPGEWNRLKVRVAEDGLKCFVNGKLVIESKDRQLSGGQVGLAKFRTTKAEFKRFEVASEIGGDTLDAFAKKWFTETRTNPEKLEKVTGSDLAALARSPDATVQEFARRAFELQQQADLMRKLADDVRLMPIVEQLGEWVSEEDQDDLLRGALLIASIDAPDLDIDAYVSRVDQMASDVKEDLPEDATAAERLRQLDQYLFEENGFRGGREEYYHPANSHLNRVIDDREGLPITMAILYIELGRRLDLKIEGVGLPGHFIVRHVISDKESEYVDVFERAQRLTDQDVRRIVANFGGRLLRDEDLVAQAPLPIMIRVLRNLMGSAGREQDAEAILRYTHALVALQPNDPDYRMMRASILHQTERDSLALEDLNWLLNKEPEGMNVDEIQRMRDFLSK